MFFNGFSWPIEERWAPPMKEKMNPYGRWQVNAICMISLISWFLRFDCLCVCFSSIFNSNGESSIANLFAMASFGSPVLLFLLGFRLLKYSEQYSKWWLSKLYDLRENRNPGMASTPYCRTRIGSSVSQLLKPWYAFTLSLCLCIRSPSLLNVCTVSVPMMNR